MSVSRDEQILIIMLFNYGCENNAMFNIAQLIVEFNLLIINSKTQCKRWFYFIDWSRSVQLSG
ncbi:hypothetical protein MACH09_21950 [Vibrio sp. MACH09]|nr:hypothetical protein MACH09_21950 [Vibrio sp. MACH09]